MLSVFTRRLHIPGHRPASHFPSHLLNMFYNKNVILSDSEESLCLLCVKGGVTDGDGGIVNPGDSSELKFLRMTYFYYLKNMGISARHSVLFISQNSRLRLRFQQGMHRYSTYRAHPQLRPLQILPQLHLPLRFQTVGHRPPAQRGLHRSAEG